MEYPNRIRELRESQRLTLEELAAAANISVSYLSRLETGERNLSMKTIKSISGALRVKEGAVLSEDDHIDSADIAGADGVASEDDAPQVHSDPDQLDYAGILEAGAFRQVDELDQRQPHKLSFLRSPNYPKARHIAFKVMGDSMDLEHIVEGMWVEGVDIDGFVDYYGDLKDGDLVVVERTEAEGALRERTVKKLAIFSDHWELHPRSSNPKHQKIVIPRGHDPTKHNSVSIIALVIRWFMEPPRR